MKTFSRFVSASFFVMATVIVSWAQAPAGNQPVRENFMLSRSPAAFVVNKGQFNVFSENGTRPGYGSRLGNSMVLFGYNSIQFVQLVNTREAKGEEADRDESGEFVCQRQVLRFLDANENADFFPDVELQHCFAYADPELPAGVIKSKGFEELKVVNLYPGIDVTYTFAAEGGLKYAFTIHPGANPEAIRMHWSGTDPVRIDASGNLVMNSPNGIITDNAPMAFLKDGMQHEVACTFSLQNDIIFFEVEKYASSETLVIDPWVLNPNFVNYNSGYDIQHDPAGDIYIYGGANPYELQKYDSTGALLWVFNTLAGGYYGDFTIDPNGFIYIIYGPWTNQCLKLDPTAGQVWNSFNPVSSGSVETYRIQLNPVTAQMVVVGMELTGGLTPMTETIDTATGAYSPYVHHPTCINGEVRSLAVDENGDSYSLVFSGGSAFPGDNLIWKQDAGLATTGSVVNGYLLYETEPSSTDSWYSGYNGIAVGSRALYTYDGQVVKKWNKSTLALIDSAVIAGGIHYGTAGLCVDSCGNVYVGGPNSILMFDSTMTLVATAATPGAVYDVNFGNKPGEILACGFNFAGSFNFPACYLDPVAIFVAPNHICPGTCTDFVNLSSNGQTFLWQFPGATPSVSTDFNPTNICYNTPGSYSVTLVVSNSNGSDTLSLNNFITVYPYPPPQGILQNGDTLFANPGAVTYQWYLGGSLIPGATDYYYIASVSGNYNVVATDLNGCEVEAAIFDVIASLSAAAGQGFSPYLIPNPAMEFITVVFTASVQQDIDYVVYNALGEQLIRAHRSVQHISSGDHRKAAVLNIASLSRGIYYLEFSYRTPSGSKELFRSKFLKQ